MFFNTLPYSHVILKYVLFVTGNWRALQMKAKTTSGILLLLGIFMIFCGILRGEADLVFSKAVRLCLECVGIG